MTRAAVRSDRSSIQLVSLVLLGSCFETPFGIRHVGHTSLRNNTGPAREATQHAQVSRCGTASTSWWQSLRQLDYESVMCRLQSYQHGKTAAELQKVRKNSEKDGEALLYALMLYGFLALLTFGAFVALLAWAPAMYSRRCNDCNDNNGGQKLNWWRLLISVEDDEVVEKAGLDGLMLVELLRFGRNFALLTGPVLMIVLGSVHYMQAERFNHLRPKGLDLLNAISIQSLTNIPPGKDGQPIQIDQWLLWLHAGAVWFVVMVGMTLLAHTHSRFAEKRFEWLDRVPVPRATTLLVQNVPAEYRSDQALKGFFARVFTEPAVKEATIVRRTTRLRKLIWKQEHCRTLLAEAESQWERVGCDEDKRPRTGYLPCWPGDDALDKYRRLLQKSESDVAAERERVEHQVPLKDPSVCSSSGFITFTSRRWRRLAVKEQLTKDGNTFKMSLAPDPTDVIFEDLALDTHHRYGSKFFAVVCLSTIFVVWMPVVVLISSLSDMHSLKEYVPYLRQLINQFPPAEAFLEGILPTLVLRGFMSLLPLLLMGVIENLLLPKARTRVQLQMQEWNFYFHFFFVLLVTLVGQSLFFAFMDVLDHPRHLLELLALNLPCVSHFYSLYMILGWFVVVMEVVRPYPLMIYLGWRTTVGADEAAELAEPKEASAGDGIGARMSRTSLMVAILMVFCTCSPEIAIFGWLYFATAGPCYRYLISSAEVRKPDSGGVFWVRALNHIVVALVLYVFLMVGILKRQATSNGPVILALSSLAYCYFGYSSIKSVNWEIPPFLAIADSDRESDEKPWQGQDGCYKQPECHSPDAGSAAT